MKFVQTCTFNTCVAYVYHLSRHIALLKLRLHLFIFHHSTLVCLCAVSGKPPGPTGTCSGHMIEQAHTNARAHTHRAAVYLEPNWTLAKSSSSSESSSLLSWDMSERALKRNDKGLTWQGREEDVVQARGDRRGVKKHEDKCGMVTSHKKRRQGKRGSTKERMLEGCMLAWRRLLVLLFWNIH